jgi:hypothetical protein
MLALTAFTALPEGRRFDVGEALAFGGLYAALNPLYWLVPMDAKSIDVRAVLFAILKVTAIVAGWRLASAEPRRVLAALLALDLMNSALLGIGRWSTGIEAAVSWRYQYISLLCFAPFLGVLVQRIRVKPALAFILVLWTLLLAWPWRRHAPRWAAWRGIEVRRKLETAPTAERFSPSQLTIGEVRRLVSRYGLD